MKKLTWLAAATAAALALTSCATTDEALEAPGAPAANAAPVAPPKTNLAYGKYSKSNNHIYEFTSDRAFDGEVLSYWEGGANAYPNDLSVDLGSVKPIHQLTLRLNPKRIWQPRTQTVEVLVSKDGDNFTSLVAKADYDFDPIDSDNSVVIPVSGDWQHIMLRFTANTEATAGQLAELEVQ